MKDKSNTLVAVILYTSKTLSNREHPIMLRITQNRQRKYLSLGISCQEKLWNSDRNRPKTTHPNYQLISSIISEKIAEYEEKRLELKKEKKTVSADTLIQEVEKPMRNITVMKFLDEVIANLKEAKKIGNAGVYQDLKNVLTAYLGSKDITFSSLDYPFLVKLETFQRKNGNLETSLSTRFRTLRSLYNMAILQKIAKESEYPFKQFKVSKFDITTRRRALTKDQIKTLEAYTPKANTLEFESQQYFLFSYYGLGINFADIAFLKWSNEIGDRIFYKRMKTGKEINYKLQEQALKILDYWRPITGGDPDNYIFPILDKQRHITPTQIDNRIHKVLGRVNEDLKDIGKTLKFDIPLTTYVARHTFATVLKRSGVKTSVISEAMGHETEAITQTYLDSFENDVVDEAMTNL